MCFIKKATSEAFDVCHQRATDHNGQARFTRPAVSVYGQAASIQKTGHVRCVLVRAVALDGVFSFHAPKRFCSAKACHPNWYKSWRPIVISAFFNDSPAATLGMLVQNGPIGIFRTVPRLLNENIGGFAMTPLLGRHGICKIYLKTLPTAHDDALLSSEEGGRTMLLHEIRHCGGG